MFQKVLGIALFAVSAFAAPAKVTVADHSKKAPQNVPAPDIEAAGYISEDQIAKLAENFHAEAKRRPSSGASVASGDLLSRGYIEFRDKLINAKTGEEFYNILKDANDNYKNIPASETDLKFMVARLATWLPFRGIAWKITPMIHQIVVTQEVLLGAVRNLAEQAMINFPESHIQAQMLFLTEPVTITNSKGVTNFEKRFNYESDFMQFLATDVYKALSEAVSRIESIKEMVNVQKDGKKTPVVFDAQIRFGKNISDESQDAADRFKFQGAGEQFATLARLNRRMAALSSTVAYNWNGYYAMRRAVGKEFGVGVAESVVLDIVAGSEGNEYVNGPTRKQRTNIVKKSSGLLFELTPRGKEWMATSYFHLHRSQVYLEQAWSYLKSEPASYVMQLDPEVFMARREQMDQGMIYLKKIAGVCGAKDKAKICDPKLNGEGTIRGFLDGQELRVNLKAFYENPPRNMKNLLPTGFYANEDIAPLRSIPKSYYSTMKETRKPDVISVKIGSSKTEFRNYLYGRAKTWDNSENGYGRIFPGVTPEGVARAMRIVNETRGARMVGNAFTAFIR